MAKRNKESALTRERVTIYVPTVLADVLRLYSTLNKQTDSDALTEQLGALVGLDVTSGKVLATSEDDISILQGASQQEVTLFLVQRLFRLRRVSTKTE